MSVAANVGFGLRRQGVPGAEVARGWPSCWRWCGWRRSPTAGRTRCPAASASAWRWPAAWPPGRTCCCWTSRCPPWTAACARRPGPSWCGCSASSAPPSSWSRTTRRRRCPWPPASACWRGAAWRRSAPRPRSTSARPAAASPPSWARPTSCPPGSARPALLDLPSLGAVAQADTAGLSGRRARGAAAGAPAPVAAARRSGPNAVGGQVTDSAYRGTVVDHRVRVGGGTLLLVSQALATARPGAAAGRGGLRVLAARRLHPAAGMSRWLVLGPVWAWLLLFVALPALIVVALSFSQAAASVPPYDPLLTWDGWRPVLHLLGDNYAALVADGFYLDAALQSLLVASVSSRAVPADRLPDGPGHRPRARAVALAAAAAGDAAVLDRVPAAHRRLDRPAGRRRLDQRRAAGARV